MKLISFTHQPTRKAIGDFRARIKGAAMEKSDWRRVLTALEYAIEKHDGMLRKDEVTPYILHPVQVANHILTLPDLTRRVTAVAVGLTHDLMEDCGLTYQTLVDELGGEIADGTEVMSKKVDGIKKSNEQYFTGLSRCEIGSICKPSDRFNNQSSMAGVFTLDKAVETVEFTREWILPMVKVARRRFNAQELAYENLKTGLNTQIDLVLALSQQWRSVQALQG